LLSSRRSDSESAQRQVMKKWPGMLPRWPAEGCRPRKAARIPTDGAIATTRARAAPRCAPFSCVWRRHRIARYISGTMSAPPIAVPRYFTVAEVARALGVGEHRFRALVDAGNGPPVTRLSKCRLLFRDDALTAWLTERGIRLAG
jgi:hypothetical protein